MTTDQMRRALELQAVAARLQRQLREFVLLKRGNAQETIYVGYPAQYEKDRYSPEPVQIPEDARRYVFRLWRKEVAHKLNEVIRELNQLGASHNFALIEFSPATGEPE